jgi:hypothetical protein
MLGHLIFNVETIMYGRSSIKIPIICFVSDTTRFVNSNTSSARINNWAIQAQMNLKLSLNLFFWQHRQYGITRTVKIKDVFNLVIFFF